MRAISFPFDVSRSVGVATTTNYDDVVRGQVIDALMTNQGERVFRADYGSDIQSALFDPSDELVRSDAASFIKTRLEQLVPRAFVSEVAVISPDNEPGVVYIDILYKSAAYQRTQTLRVPFSSEFIQRSIGGQL
jgi:phage baseplate assembly protein W